MQMLVHLVLAVAVAPGLVVSQSGRIYVDGVRVARGTQPVWSADGRRIAYVRAGRIFVAAADGTDERLAARNVPSLASPAWSPDGKRLAYSGTNDIFTVELASGTVTRLTHSRRPWLANYTPVYSPDGRRIAFSRSTDAFNTDIFVMKANGTGLRRLTRTLGTDAKQGEEHGPTWSPDGRTIVFVSNRDQRSWELYSIRSDGTHERRITNTPSPRYDEDSPRFSRDGKRILYAHDGRIAVINRDGTGVQELGLGTSADW